MNIKFKEGEESDSSTWAKFSVKDIDVWKVKRDGDYDKDSTVTEYQCNDVPIGKVFTIFEQSGDKRGTQIFKFTIAAADHEVSEIISQCSDSRYCKGNFKILCQASTKVKAARLMEWWTGYMGDRKEEFAIHCAANIDKRGLKECPAFEVPEVENEEITEEKLPLEQRKVWIDARSITLDAGTQTRRPSQEKIEEYAEMMNDGVWNWLNFPLIIVFEDGDRRYPSDGHHRIQGAINANQQKILVKIREGTLRDAVWESFASNKFHGLSLTNEDKRERVKAILSDFDWQTISDRQIAEHSGVSAPFVGKIREKLVESGTVNVSSERKGKDGRVQSVGKIGTKAKVEDQVKTVPSKSKIGSDEQTKANHNPLPVPNEGNDSKKEENQQEFEELNGKGISDRLLLDEGIVEDPEAIEQGYLVEEMIDLEIAPKVETLKPTVSLEDYILVLVKEFGAKAVAEAALHKCEEADVRQISSELRYQLGAVDDG